MREMGWSWSDLMTTPAAVVDELVLRLSAENTYTEKRRKLDRQMSDGRKS